MPRNEPVRVIRQPSISSPRADVRLEFICCVGGLQPQISKLWSFAKDRITREVHPFARIDVGDFSRYCFQTNYTTEMWRRVAIYIQKSINGSVEWLGVPTPVYDTVAPWRSVNPIRPAYLPRVPLENNRTTTRHVRDARLRKSCLLRAQNVLYAHHIGGDGRVYWLDDDWNILWDKPADQ